MKLLDIVTAPWAIQPDKLLEIRAIYATHLRGEKIDLAGVEARIGRKLENADQGYTVVDGGVAVIPLQGVMAKKANLFSQISGGASMELAARDIKAALADKTVKSLLLYVDSPGGTVDGTQALADVVAQAAREKPVVAFADGTMASAAYWVGSAADEVIASAPTTQIGSIGVVAAHRDVSGMEAAQGVKTTEITAGKYKRIASQYGPLTEEGRAAIQEQVDALYSIFVDAVAKNRGADPQTVVNDMADGRVFLAQEAVRRGLADRIASLDTVLARMAGGEWPARRAGAAGVAATAAQAAAAGAAADVPLPNSATERTDMDLATLREQHPDLAAALLEEGRVAGAAAERDRILGIEARALPGHAALIAEMKADGQTTPDQAASRILAAEQASLAAQRQQLSDDAPAPLAHAPAPSEAAPAADSRPVEARCQDAWDKDATLRAEFGTLDAYIAYQRATESGRVKVLGRKAA